jgi:2-methylcitrate dehydratase
MKLARRRILQMAASAAVLPAIASAASAQGARPLAERLADYAHRLRFDDIDAATVERAKAHVIDTIGCGIAAFDEGPVRICRDLALAAQGDATVIGTTRRSTPELASFANGVAFRYYDLNDAYVGGLSGHPSDNIAPCLAVAEAEGASVAGRHEAAARQSKSRSFVRSSTSRTGVSGVRPPRRRAKVSAPVVSHAPSTARRA